MTLIEVQRHIDSFARPQGFNTYSWRVVKKLAMKAWEAHLEGKTFQRSLNFMCKEFYMMIQKPDGQFIVPKDKIRSPFV